jgi:hypothetical protein
MLLEQGEFVKKKNTEEIYWIETIDKSVKALELGKMNCRIVGSQVKWEKIYFTITFEEFYKEYEDVKTKVPF